MGLHDAHILQALLEFYAMLFILSATPICPPTISYSAKATLCSPTEARFHVANSPQSIWNPGTRCTVCPISTAAIAARHVWMPPWSYLDG